MYIDSPLPTRAEYDTWLASTAAAKAAEPAPNARGLALPVEPVATPSAMPSAPAAACSAALGTAPGLDGSAPVSSLLSGLSLDVHSGDALVLEALGPVVVNMGGTLSRITNWPTMTEGERETAKRLISRRNGKRLQAFRDAGSLKPELVSALSGSSGSAAAG